MAEVDEFVLHSSSLKLLKRIEREPVQSLLLVGPRGSGKDTLAKLSAARLLGFDNTKQLLNHRYLRIISPDDKGVISIEVIRPLRSFLALKTSGVHSIRRVVIIESAGAMTIEAQNSLLKMLEEPPADTAFVLTANNESELLPTVVSRCQTVVIMSPKRAEVSSFFLQKGFTTTDVARNVALSGGLVGLTSVLLNDNDDHPMATAVNDAKNLLSLSAFERVAQVDALSKDRDGCFRLLDAFKRICQGAIEQTAKKQNADTLRKWQARLRLIHDAENALQVNASTKLTLTNLFMQL